MTKKKSFGLARALSKMGHCSRSQATELVRAGRVRLNDDVVRNPEAPVQIDRDRILVDGSPIAAVAKVYLAMNKPRGIVTSASDEKGRRTVYDLLPPEHEWVGPVGRLDKASEGLLLLTNDSEWAAQISDPLSHLEKTYHVQIDRVAEEQLLRAITRGVRDRGERLHARAVRMIRAGEKNCWLEIVLDEGKNRHIRRLLSVLEVEVLRLVRISIGSLELGHLQKGGVRPLTRSEKASIDEQLSRKKPPETSPKNSRRMPIDVG